MPNSLRAIRQLFATSWSRQLQYRADIALWFFFSIITVLIPLAVWYTVTSSRSGGTTPKEILTYYVLVTIVTLLTRSWRGFYISEQILTGKAVQYILKPPVYLWEIVTGTVATRIIQSGLPVAVFLFIAIVFPHFFAETIYQSKNILLFIPSLIIAGIIWFMFDVTIGLLAFWLEDVHELFGYNFLIMQLTSGILIPYALLPHTIKTIFSFLPFRYIISAPIELLLGQSSTQDITTLFFGQSAWLIIFAITVYSLWHKGVKQYAVPGQ